MRVFCKMKNRSLASATAQKVVARFPFGFAVPLAAHMRDGSRASSVSTLQFSLAVPSSFVSHNESASSNHSSSGKWNTSAGSQAAFYGLRAKICTVYTDFVLYKWVRMVQICARLL